MPIKNAEPSARGFRELGTIGLKQYNGFVQEDFVPKLRSLRTRIDEYKKMSNDPIVGAILFAVEMHLRRAGWRVEPASDSEEDKQLAEFVAECKNDMSHTFQDFLSEVLSMLPYGFSVHEIVYKLRPDGKVGWKKLPVRAQDSIDHWDFDNEDGLNGVWQMTEKGDSAYIPIDKMLLFRPSSYKNNPEGRSVLRSAYRPYYFKSKLEIIEAIGIERNLSGYPVVKVPGDIFAQNDLAQAQRQYAESMVTRIRKDEQMGAVLPPGWELDLLSSNGNANAGSGEVIARYSVQIAQSLLSDIIMLGHFRSGSYALSEQKYELFVTALDSWLDSIAEVFNRYAIPRLLRLNGYDVSNRKKLPQLVHDPVCRIDPQKLANIIFRMVGVDAMRPDDKLEKYLRNFLGLPAADDKTVRGQEPKDVGVDSVDRTLTRTDNDTRPAQTDGEYEQTSSSHRDIKV